MIGEFEEARSLIGRAGSILDELGMTLELAATGGLTPGMVELTAGEAVAAEAAVRPAYEALAAMGEQARLSSRAAILAASVYEQGLFEEALRLTDEADAVSAADDIEPQGWLHGVRAKALARLGRFEEAEREARATVELMEPTDWLPYRAMAWFDLGEVLRLAGRHDEAAEAFRRAGTSTSRRGARCWLPGPEGRGSNSKPSLEDSWHRTCETRSTDGGPRRVRVRSHRGLGSTGPSSGRMGSMRVTPREILGRDAELAEIERFVGSVAAGPSTLILEGAAGIGKTTLWDAGVALASEAGHQVLSCRPVEAEARLSYTALGDLLDLELPPLPAPQERALDAALLRDRIGGTSTRPARGLPRDAGRAPRARVIRSGNDRDRRHPVAGCALRPGAVVRGSPSPRRTDRAPARPTIGTRHRTARPR